MKKNLLSIFTVLTLSTAATQAQTWNISEAPFGSPISYATETTVEGFTIAPSDKAIVIDANSKKLDDYTFTHRIKLPGAGVIADETKPYLPSGGNNFNFKVEGNASITIYGMSASSSETRTLMVTDGEKEVGTYINDGKAIDKATIEYTGTAATIYLYSAKSGFNLYLIKVEAKANSINNSTIDKGEIVAAEYYDITGRKTTENTVGLILKKLTYEDGSTEVIKTIVRQ